MMFKALIVNQAEDGTISTSLEEKTLDFLPAEGEVLVEVHYSDVNYKDGMCLTGAGRLVREYPHIAGIDFAGIVLESADDRYKPGDAVIATGWRMGEVWFGGYAQRARVKADWLVPLPAGMTARQAMAIGTAGLSAMLAVLMLEDNGLSADQGDVLVTGATGGVGSVAVAVLANRGYQVAAVTGDPAKSEAYLTRLGASKLVPRSDLNELVKRPLESELWAGCVDAVGGEMLARILGQLKNRAMAAAVGNAGGVALPTNVIPFLLRGIILAGVDSASAPTPDRIRAWEALAQSLPADLLDEMTSEISLADVPAAAQAILKGETRGRIVVNLMDS